MPLNWLVGGSLASLGWVGAYLLASPDRDGGVATSCLRAEAAPLMTAEGPGRIMELRSLMAGKNFLKLNSGAFHASHA